MLTRTRSNSFVVRGALTRAVQFAGRSTGQGDNNALIASVPRVLDHRLPHRHSCARSTSPADKRIPLDIPQYAQQMVVTLYRETLESSLIKVPVAHRPVRDAPAYRVLVRQPSKKVRQLAVLLRPGISRSRDSGFYGALRTVPHIVQRDRVSFDREEDAINAPAAAVEHLT